MERERRGSRDEPDENDEHKSTSEIKSDATMDPERSAGSSGNEASDNQETSAKHNEIETTGNKTDDKRVDGTSNLYKVEEDNA